ncbi:hypothetical protein KUM39_05065 [Streptomyces sp. J2-1]|uniref:hypothetical protein n=1 Tax=Streptomyces corallincola TaxID=2851888 RepID=UPI001C388605|nr:hypothetical protein [Streptomyces corallincola]MBV2353735.1 hypothetical protein [Streptomyces corallincola]
MHLRRTASALGAATALALALGAPTAQAAGSVPPEQVAAGRICADQLASLQDAVSEAQYLALEGQPVDWDRVHAELDGANGAACESFTSLTAAPLALVGDLVNSAQAYDAAGDHPATFCPLDDAVWTLGPTAYEVYKAVGIDRTKPVRGTSSCA